MRVTGTAESISRLAHNAPRTCTTKRVWLFPSSSSCRLILHLSDWERLKGYLGVLSEIFPKLSDNVVEKPLFKTLREANYDTLFYELFENKDDRFKDWTTRDWICLDWIQKFFRISVFRWWCERKVRGNIFALVRSRRRGFTFLHQRASRSRKIAGKFIIPACRHNVWFVLTTAPRHVYYCQDQYFETGHNHATHFNVCAIRFSCGPLLKPQNACNTLVSPWMKWLRRRIIVVIERWEPIIRVVLNAEHCFNIYRFSYCNLLVPHG